MIGELDLFNASNKNIKLIHINVDGCAGKLLLKLIQHIWSLVEK